MNITLYLIGVIAGFSLVQAIIESPAPIRWSWAIVSVLASITVINVGVAAGGWSALNPWRRGNG